MHTKNVRMRPVPLWGRCTGSTDFTSRKKNTRKTNGATKQHSMRDQRQLWKSFSSSFASFEFTYIGNVLVVDWFSLMCDLLHSSTYSGTLYIPSSYYTL